MSQPKRINNILTRNPRYARLQKPLEAAKVCDIARKLANRRFGVISFKNGLLTLAVNSSAQAGNLQAESQEIIEEINQKIGERRVERIRFKISN